jgi:hypothetical protein
MDAAFKSILATEITVAPFDRGNQKVAYLIAPKSYRRRAWVALWRMPRQRLRSTTTRLNTKFFRCINRLVRRPFQSLHPS